MSNFHEFPIMSELKNRGIPEKDKVISVEDWTKIFKNRPLARSSHLKAHGSLLSSVGEAPNMRGMFNLFVMLLVTLNLRLVIENLIKYGWLIPNPISVLTVNQTYVPVYFIYLFLILFPGVTYAIEKFVSPRYEGRSFANILHFFSVAFVAWLPYRAVANTDGFCAGSVPLLMCSAIYIMKIISYVQVCSDLHFAKRKGCLQNVISDKEELAIAEKYPDCLTLRQWYDFVAFPTLNFQLRYPRTTRVSKIAVLRYCAEVVFCSGLITILAEQYMRPILVNAHIDMTRHYLAKSWTPLVALSIERWLKLIMPALYLWLLSFVGVFHSYLNLLAELTKFADRRFYDDWWNAVGFRDYWQKWNLPVHRWMVRHIYGPFKSMGVPDMANAAIVFLLSGLVHEYIIVVPLHLPMNGVVASAFLIQIPLIMITDTKFVKDRPVLGNCLFWFTNCFAGQPAAILIFFILKQAS